MTPNQRIKQNMWIQDTNGLLWALKPGGKPLDLTTNKGLDLLFVFLSVLYATDFVTKKPKVPIVFLCGLEARYEFLTEEDDEALEAMFVPFENFAPSEGWAQVIEFWAKLEGSGPRATEAITHYLRTPKGKRISVFRPYGFDDEYLLELMRRMKSARTIRMIESVKETVPLTPEEKDFMDRIMRPLQSGEAFVPGRNDDVLKNTINRKCGFSLIATQTSEEGEHQ
ncbi:hypothetical protein [Candidatus Finniella inopinata]|uniref:Uncharacterized protein n=1 Tax=Candidatus Finniella inopinata TaxID=1696036 RepID=A0A4Q7DFI0_9PROT|nr:hypothetical protein [Candidatus Finniella inopinata]RZI45110.1 hypothetical protein EQU50_08215 [Candidatus Finniella inopinata]